MTIKTEKMYFTVDGYFNGVHLYEKGKVYDIPTSHVAKWLRRGAILASEAPEAEVIPEETTPVIPTTPEEVPPSTEEEEDTEEEDTEEEDTEEGESTPVEKSATKKKKKNKNK